MLCEASIGNESASSDEAFIGRAANEKKHSRDDFKETLALNFPIHGETVKKENGNEQGGVIDVVTSECMKSMCVGVTCGAVLEAVVTASMGFMSNVCAVLRVTMSVCVAKRIHKVVGGVDGIEQVVAQKELVKVCIAEMCNLVAAVEVVVIDGVIKGNLGRQIRWRGGLSHNRA